MNERSVTHAEVGLVVAAGALLLTIGHVTSQSVSNGLGVLIIVLVVGACGLVLGERHPVGEVVPTNVRAERGTWIRVGLLLALVVVVCVDRWFRGPGGIGFEDIAPPEGTQWIDRVLEPWTWNGINLGGPNTSTQGFVRAALLWVVTSVGGSAALAQQLELTLLLAGAAVLCMAMLGSVGVRPVAAGVAGFFYVVNPGVVSQVHTNSVFMAALVLMPGVILCLVQVARRRISLLGSTAVLGLSGPLFGLMYANPPLLIALLAAVLIALVAVAVEGGRRAVRRFMKAAVLGGAAVIVTAVFAVAPAIYALHFLAHGQLESLASWHFTESRSTLSNALWLNTTWQWDFSAYHPYRLVFDTFPLRTMRYAPMVLALLPLALPAAGSTRRRRSAAVAMIAVLLLMVLAMGTGFPSGPLYRAVYSLPFGWLLREPGRFLIVAFLAVAFLIGLGVDALLAALHSAAARAAVVVLAVSAIAVAGYPNVTGAVTPGAREAFPSEHVTVPGYWREAAGTLNASTGGSVLVLPSNDFYEMPNDWYYGVDSFINAIVKRRTVAPVSEGYFASDEHLIAAVKTIETALLNQQWQLARAVMAQLDLRDIVVRGDLDTGFPGRSFTDPQRIIDRLRADPLVTEQATSGPVKLFHAEQSPAPQGFVTTEDDGPDLRALGLLPPGTAIVTSRPMAGRAHLLSPPDDKTWQLAVDGSESAPTVVPVGRVVEQGSLDDPDGGLAPLPSPQVRIEPAGRVSLDEATERTSCSDPALQIPSSRSCTEWRVDAAVRHRVVVTLDVGGGAGIAVCFRVAAGPCIGPDSFVESGGRAAATYTPKGDERAEDGVQSVLVTSEAGVTVSDPVMRLMPDRASVLLVAPAPRGETSDLELTVQHETSSAMWSAAHAQRVEVDGVQNGWLAPAGVTVRPHFGPGPVLRATQVLSGLGWMSSAITVIALIVRRRRARA